MNLTKDQLLFLISDPIKYGTCGHVSLHPLPNDRFEVRNELTLGDYADYPPCIHTRAYRASLRVNGPVHESVKLVTRHLLHEMLIVSPYVKDLSVDITVLGCQDKPLIKRLLASYVRYGAIQYWKRNKETYESAVKRELAEVSVEKMNSFIHRCNLSISQEFDLQSIDIEDVIALMDLAQDINVDHVLSSHAFHCKRILNK